MPPRKKPAALTSAELASALPKKGKKEDAPDPMAAFDAAVTKIRAAHGDTVLRLGSDFPSMERIPSGIFSLDLALGVSDGEVGFPRGRISLIAGSESACKTLICLWLMAEFQRRGEPVLLIDAEKSWDKDWAGTNGLDPSKVLVQPSESMENTLDILAEFVRVMPSGLIVVDSFAQLTPKAEIEASFEEWQQGLMARLANKGFRSMQAGMNAAANEFLTHGPTIVIIQQFRSSISTGANKVMPGGEGQKFAGSIIVHMRAGAKIWHVPGKGEVSDGSTPREPSAFVIGRVFHFDVQKNKTSAPHKFGEFKFYTTRVVDAEAGSDIRPATTNVYEQLIQSAVRAGVLLRAGASYSLADGTKVGFGLASTAKTLATDHDLYDRVYDAVLAAGTASGRRE